VFPIQISFPMENDSNWSPERKVFVMGGKKEHRREMFMRCSGNEVSVVKQSDNKSFFWF